MTRPVRRAFDRIREEIQRRDGLDPALGPTAIHLRALAREIGSDSPATERVLRLAAGLGLSGEDLERLGLWRAWPEHGGDRVVDDAFLDEEAGE